MALSPEELSTESLAEIFAAGGRPADSEREIKIIDTTLRDAHQSIWATRMRTEHIMDLLDDVTNAGFEHVDLVAPIQFDVPVRYLREDPWERVRKVHEAAPNTKFRSSVVPNEIKKYALGHYGEPLAPIDPDALEKIKANGSSEIKEGRPELEPRLPGLKEQYPDDDIDTLLLRANIPGNNVDEMRRFVAEGRAGQGEGVPGGELTKLVQKIYETTTSGEFHLKTDDLEINLTKKGEQ